MKSFLFKIIGFLFYVGLSALLLLILFFIFKTSLNILEVQKQKNEIRARLQDTEQYIKLYENSADLDFKIIDDLEFTPKGFKTILIIEN